MLNQRFLTRIKALIPLIPVFGNSLASTVKIITKTCPCNKQRFFELKKLKIFCRNSLIFFLFLLKKIDCGYTLEPPRRGGSNEYPQSMFWSKNKKNRYTPANPSFANIKVGFEGVHISRTCFPDVAIKM